MCKNNNNLIAMKKSVISIIVLSMIACSKIDNYLNSSNNKEILCERLEKIALQLPHIYSEIPQTKNSTKKIKEIVPFSKYALKPSTKNTTSTSIDGVYIVNYENNEGYAIFTEDEKLLAYSDRGNITDKITDPGLEYVLGEIPAYMAKIGGAIEDTLPSRPDLGPIIERHIFRTEWSNNKKGPLMVTKWEQNEPFNNKVRLCGYKQDGTELHSPAGCVAIAAAQIMAYHEEPESVGETNINWSRAKSSPYMHNTSPDADGIAELVLAIGDAVDMQYGCGTEGDMNGSHPSVLFNNDGNAFWNMNYESTGHYNYNFDLVKSDIDASRPVYASGYRDSNWIGFRWGGHAWVMDGYNVQNREVTTEDYYMDPLTGGILRIDVIDRYTEEQKLIHCNWGWRGKSDGWFIEGLFDCNEIVEPDSGVIVDSTMHFYSHLQILTQIRPL